jgi:hypothetical protein
MTTFTSKVKVKLMKPEKAKRCVRNLRWNCDKNKRSGLPKTGKNRYRVPAKRSIRDRGGFSLIVHAISAVKQVLSPSLIISSNLHRAQVSIPDKHVPFSKKPLKYKGSSLADRCRLPDHPWLGVLAKNNINILQVEMDGAGILGHLPGDWLVGRSMPLNHRLP